MSERNSQVHPVIRGIINRVSAEVMDEPLFADASVIRKALFDVIDAGDPTRYSSKGELGAAWLIYDLEEDYANEKRARFVDAVEKRIRELQAPPFNLGIKLENFCDRHKRLRLPAPTAIACGDCEDEMNTRFRA